MGPVSPWCFFFRRTIPYYEVCGAWRMANSSYVKASELGCVLDCDLYTGTKIGGGAATDNTGILNRFLARASAHNPLCLILDGPTLCTGIQIPQGACVKIEGLGPGTGFYIKSGSNSQVITNGASIPWAPTTPAPRPAGYVTLRDFFVNGNRGNGKSGNSNSGDARGNATGWFCGIDLVNSAEAVIDSITIYDAPTYAIRLGNIRTFSVTNCNIISPSMAGNTDGIHLDGLCSNGVISGNKFNTGDDAIALNAPEGYPGKIENITISDNVFVNCTSIGRHYTADSNVTVANVVESNSVGNTARDTSNFICAAKILGGVPGKTASEALTNSHLRGCTFRTVQYLFLLTQNIGDFSFEDILYDSPDGTAPFFSLGFAGAAPTISNLSVSGRVRLSRAGSTMPNGALLNSTVAGAVIDRLTIKSFQVFAEHGQMFAEVPFLIDMANVTIDEVVIHALDPTNVADFVNPATGFAGIGSISGPGVLASGYEFPDAVMANHTPYISATGENAGKACIKLADTVHAFGI